MTSETCILISKNATKFFISFGWNYKPPELGRLPLSPKGNVKLLRILSCRDLDGLLE